MWPIVFLGLLIASLVAWALTWWGQRVRIRQLERSKEEIQIEETLVFDFLHGLGEAFTETIRATDLHRLIVEGAGRVLDAQGGSLYMMERAGGKLAPAFISKGCPPFIDVPTDILQQTAANSAALESYLRMHAIAPGEGIIGRVWQTREPVLLTDLANAPELAGLRGTSLGAASVMVTPLLYGKQNMGVLALGNGPASPSFTQSDFVVFKSIAEQSAFALYNAIIYSEANEKKRLDHDLEIARETSSASSCRAKLRLSRDLKSAESIFPPGRSAAITLITSKSTRTGSGWRSRTSRERGCRLRSSWRSAGASCAARRRGIPRRRMC
jgi:FOG: GAF domain